MPSIEKQPNGKYRARYRDPNNRQRSKNFSRKIDAQHFLSTMETDSLRGEWIDPRLRRQTFEEWSDLWWQTTTKLRPTTRRGYWGLLTRHVLPYFSGQRIVDVGHIEVEQFIAHCLAKGLSPKYVRQNISVLSLIFGLAVKNGVRRDNPAKGHDLPSQQRRIQQGDVPDMDEIQHLVEHVKDPYKPAVWLFAFAGLRPAELCGLRVRSIDFLNRNVHITETLLPVHAFADVPHRSQVEGPPKTEAGIRIIPLPVWLVEDLALMLAVRSDEQNREIDPLEPLFITQTGLPLHRDRFRQSVIRPALRAAGLSETIRTYDLRHSHASMLFQEGANPLAVTQRMGQSDPAVTLRIYGHLFEDAQKELTEKLDQRRQASTSHSGKEGQVFRLGE